MTQPKKSHLLFGGQRRNPPPPNRPPARVPRIPREQRRRSHGNPPGAPAAGASWLLVCWGFVGALWRGVKKCVRDGAKATKKGVGDLWGALKKGVCVVWKALSDAGSFVLKKVKWTLEESLVLYERANSFFIPREDAWWVQFIRAAKIPYLKEVVKGDTGFLMRIIWLALFILAFWNVTDLSVEAYEEYEKYPVQFTFESQETDVGDVAFPAIALSWAYNLKTAFLDLVDDALSKIKSTGAVMVEGMEFSAVELSTLAQMLQAFCQPKVSLGVALKFGPLMDLFVRWKIHQTPILDNPDLELLAEKIVPALQKAGAYCTSRIVYCAWNGEQVPCTEMFKPELTESGISCVFNKMPVSLMRRNRSLQTLINNDDLTNEERNLKWKDWKLESIIKNPTRRTADSSFSDVPLTQKSANKISGATVIIKTDEQDSSCPQFDSSGPRVSISFPLDDHNHGTEQFRTPADSFIQLNAVPELITADKDIKDVKKEKRACLFPEEGSLEFYSVYTQENCKKECLANFIRRKFNCSLLSMPNGNGTRLCNFEEVTEVLYDEEHIRSDECTKKCLPTCGSVSYKSDTTVERLNNETIDALRQSFGFPTSVVHVSIEGQNVIAKRRSLRQTFSDLIGLIGGLLGAILNLSYFLMARIIFALRFLLPPLFVLIKLILLLLLRIILCLCCCQFRKKVSASPEDNNPTVPESNSDGTVAESNSDGTVPESNSDGTVPESNSDGTVPESNSDVTVPESNSDGTQSPTWTLQNANGVPQTPTSPSAGPTSDVVLEMEESEVENIFTTSRTSNLQI